MHFSYTTGAILSFSIFIAGIIGIFKFAQIRNEYRPFIYLIWIGCLNESISVYLALNHHYNFVNSVIYDLCESLLLLWFFKNLGAFKGKKAILYFLAALFISVWVLEIFFENQFGTSFTYYFNLVYFFSVVVLSIRVINDLLFTERELLKNPIFLICIGLILFFTYGIIDRMFRLYGLKESKTFRQNVQAILMIINLLCNLVYALAVLWMRKRQAFTMQF